MAVVAVGSTCNTPALITTRQPTELLRWVRYWILGTSVSATRSDKESRVADALLLRALMR
jgi:hypothetical protein